MFNSNNLELLTHLHLLSKEAASLAGKVKKISESMAYGSEQRTRCIDLYNRLLVRFDRRSDEFSRCSDLSVIRSTCSDYDCEPVQVSGEDLVVSKGRGRPLKADKKVQINVKVKPVLKEWLSRQKESNSELIETALRSYYQISDDLF